MYSKSALFVAQPGRMPCATFARAYSLSPDGRTLLSRTDARIQVFAVPDNWGPQATGALKLLNTWELNGDVGRTMSWNPQGTRVAVESMRDYCQPQVGLEVLDVATGRWTPAGGNHGTHEGHIWDIAWAPDGKHFASAGDDQQIHFFDADPVAHRSRQSCGDACCHSLSWHQDGESLALVQGNQIKVLALPRPSGLSGAYGLQAPLLAVAPAERPRAVGWAGDQLVAALVDPTAPASTRLHLIDAQGEISEPMVSVSGYAKQMTTVPFGAGYAVLLRTAPDQGDQRERLSFADLQSGRVLWESDWGHHIGAVAWASSRELRVVQDGGLQAYELPAPPTLSRPRLVPAMDI